MLFFVALCNNLSSFQTQSSDLVLINLLLFCCVCTYLSLVDITTAYFCIICHIMHDVFIFDKLHDICLRDLSSIDPATHTFVCVNKICIETFIILGFIGRSVWKT